MSHFYPSICSVFALQTMKSLANYFVYRLTKALQIDNITISREQPEIICYSVPLNTAVLITYLSEFKGSLDRLIIGQSYQWNPRESHIGCGLGISIIKNINLQRLKL